MSGPAQRRPARQTDREAGERPMTLAEIVAAEGGPSPVIGTKHIDAFSLTDDEPEFVIRRRHDDLDRLKVARWQGGAIGWCVGVLTAVAVIEVVKWVGL